MLIRGVRGATTVDEDSEAAIIEATKALLAEIIAANEIAEEMVASVIFTVTPDLSAAYPAKAARLLGWRRTALMGMQEMNVPGGLPRCIRVLIQWNTDKALDDVVHVYHNDAVGLRPDLAQKRADKKEQIKA